jgi:hypothetical protein
MQLVSNSGQRLVIPQYSFYYDHIIQRGTITILQPWLAKVVKHVLTKNWKEWCPNDSTLVVEMEDGELIQYNWLWLKATDKVGNLVPTWDKSGMTITVELASWSTTQS